MSRVALLAHEDLDAFLTIALNAYPGWKVESTEARQKIRDQFQQTQEQHPHINLYGLWRDDTLVGGMRLFDFTMNMLSIPIQAGGVGLVAVDLVHKKKKIARDLITFFLRHYRERGAPLAMLYAFRHEFYRKMGFGYGTKMNHYRIRPSAFPRGTSSHVRLLGPDDAVLLAACYRRLYERTHGYFERPEDYFTPVLSSLDTRAVGVERDGQITGYMIWRFRSAHANNTFMNHMDVSELAYEDSAALMELMAFLHSQADQIDRVILPTQDEAFYHLLTDPRNGADNVIDLFHETNAQGIGIMYRIVDTPGFFRTLQGHNFGGQTCTVQFTIADTLLPENDGTTVVRFEQGRATVQPDSTPDVEVRLEIGAFSSLFVGAVTFKRLYAYGMAEISDPNAVATIQALFHTEDKPMCLTRF